MLEYLLAALALIIALALMFFLGRNQGEKRKTLVVSTIAIIVILIGTTYGVLQASNDEVVLSDVLLYDAAILFAYSLIVGIVYYIQRNKPIEERKPNSTRRIALLGLLVGMSSVLMLISFPIIPAAPFLKVEVSALVIFLTLVWFDFKTAVIVSLITNIVHFFMPGSTPIIPFMDEMVNFLATMIFIMPTALITRKKDLSDKSSSTSVVLTTIIGLLGTVVLMVLFNYYINLPLIYNLPMTFNEVLAIFGLFNIIKWGINLFVINLSWRRFYLIRPNL